MKQNRLDNVFFIIIIIAVALAIINAFLITSVNDKIIEERLKIEKENAPAIISLIIINDNACEDCVVIKNIVDSLKESQFNITNEKNLDISSPEAQSLIAKYDVQKIPSIIVLGEVNKTIVESVWDNNWELSKNQAIYLPPEPPYFDVASNQVIGRVSIINIEDSACSECIDMGQITDLFESQGVIFSDKKTIDYTSQEAQSLIDKFSIKEIPALVISENILEYSAISQVWNQLNTTKKQGFYTIHSIIPPYRNIASNEIIGLVKMIILRDDSCATCHNASINKNIVEGNFGFVITDEAIVDISSDTGKVLINKYNITKVPIAMFSPEASNYAGFTTVWSKVGTVESDGWYVMRQPELIGAYRDLKTGQIIE